MKRPQCGQEWAVIVEDETSVEEVAVVFENYVSYNGSRIIIQHRTISDETEEQSKSEMIIIMKLYTPVSQDNVKDVVEYFEEQIRNPESIDGYSPRRFGERDLKYKERATWLFRTSCLTVPGWIIKIIWLTSNAMIETASADHRTVCPRFNTTHLCTTCMKSFASPVALLFHKIYEEDAIGWTKGDLSLIHI